jgi:hypothetical protein
VGKTYKKDHISLQVAQKIAKVLKNKKTRREDIQALEKSHYDYYQSLKPIYQKVIAKYTGSHFDEMNTYLRGTWEPYASQLMSLQTDINNLNQVLNNAPPIKKEIIVYRGFDFDGIAKFHNLKAGQIVDIFRDGFNSTSFTKKIGSGFTGQTCCLFVLHLPVGTKGLYIGRNSSHPEEDEFILAPGPLFRVMKTKHEPIKSKKIYHLFCVDCDQAYQKYNNLVYYKLVGPALGVAKTPLVGQYLSPQHSPIDTAGQIIPSKVIYNKGVGVIIDKALVKSAQAVVTQPVQIQILWKHSDYFPINHIELLGLNPNDFQAIEFNDSIVDRLNRGTRKPLLADIDIIKSNELSQQFYVIYSQRMRPFGEAVRLAWIKILILNKLKSPSQFNKKWLPNHFINIEYRDLDQSVPIEVINGFCVRMDTTQYQNYLNQNSDTLTNVCADKSKYIDYYHAFTSGKLIPQNLDYSIFFDCHFEGHLVLYSGETQLNKNQVFELIQQSFKTFYLDQVSVDKILSTNQIKITWNDIDNFKLTQPQYEFLELSDKVKEVDSLANVVESLNVGQVAPILPDYYIVKFDNSYYVYMSNRTGLLNHESILANVKYQLKPTKIPDV